MLGLPVRGCTYDSRSSKQPAGSDILQPEARTDPFVTLVLSSAFEIRMNVGAHLCSVSPA